MMLFIGQRCFSDVHMSCLIHVGLSLCFLPFANVSCPKYTSLDCWCLLLQTLMFLRRCTHATGYACISLDDVVCRSPMLLSKCAQTMSDASTHWLMRLIVGWLFLANIWKPRYVAYSMCTHHVSCKHALYDAALHWTIYTSWCMKDMTDVVDSMHIRHDLCI